MSYRGYAIAAAKKKKALEESQLILDEYKDTLELCQTILEKISKVFDLDKADLTPKELEFVKLVVGKTK